MALGLQRDLNKFQFERTVDWRVSFPELTEDIKLMGKPTSALADTAEKMLYRGGKNKAPYIFATGCSFIPGMITTRTAAQNGYVDSGISFQNLSITLYTDASMIIENLLQIWCASSFLENGCMPVFPEGENYSKAKKDFIQKYQIINPVQKVVVERITPFRLGKALVSLIYDVPGVSAASNLPIVGGAFGVVEDFLDRNKISDNEIQEEYTFNAYLASEPHFNGNADDQFRSVQLSLNVTGFERKRALTEGKESEIAAAQNRVASLTETLVETKATADWARKLNSAISTEHMTTFLDGVAAETQKQLEEASSVFNTIVEGAKDRRKGR